MGRILLYLFLHLLLVSCSSRPTLQADLTLSVEQIIQDQKEAMSWFWASYGKEFEPVFGAHKRVWDRVGWVVVQPSSTMMAISNQPVAALVAIYHPQHPRLKESFPTFATSFAMGKPTILVRPDPIARRWTALFLLHELSHVVTQINQTTLSRVQDEVTAYDLEKLALNAMTRFAFDKELDAILVEAKVADESELVNPSDALIKRMLILDQRMAGQDARSRAEKEMRAGFYQVSLGIRFIETKKIAAADLQRRKLQFIEKLITSVAR